VVARYVIWGYCEPGYLVPTHHSNCSKPSSTTARCVNYLYLTSLTDEGLGTPMKTRTSTITSPAVTNSALSTFGNPWQLATHSWGQQHALLFEYFLPDTGLRLAISQTSAKGLWHISSLIVDPLPVCQLSKMACPSTSNIPHSPHFEQQINNKSATMSTNLQTNFVILQFIRLRVMTLTALFCLPPQVTQQFLLFFRLQSRGRHGRHGLYCQ
jgi:hypothetical protein